MNYFKRFGMSTKIKQSPKSHQFRQAPTGEEFLSGINLVDLQVNSCFYQSDNNSLISQLFYAHEKKEYACSIPT